jgi:VWFA-related protein
MKAHSLAFSLLLAAPFLAAQSTAPAPADPQPDQNTITLRQEVRNVVVDVVVTDKHGDPVKSLDKAHFQVMENGVAQDVSFFEEHSDADQAANPAAAQPAPELPPDTYTNVETVPGQAPLIVLLLDALNTPLSDQAYVRNQMLDYLKKIPGGTHMAIFTLGDRLQMLQGFTANPAILKAALSGRSYPTSTSVADLSGPTSNAAGLRLGGVVVPLASSVQSTRNSLDRFSNESTSFAQEMRTRLTLDALNAMAIYLDGIPGRKNLVWFAGSIPWTINPDFSLVSGVTGRVDYEDELKKLADVMAVGRIAIYPIDARGLGGAFGQQEMASQMNLAGDHMSMSNLASATGGRAMYNTNGLAGAVEKVEAINEHYYTIAYSPKDKRYDGSFRQLEIKVTDPGVKLDYRRGYYAYDPSKVTGRSLVIHSNPLRAVMQRGAPDSTQIPFHLQVKAAQRQPDPGRPSDRLGNQAASLQGTLVRYDFHWVVDLNGVEFTPEPHGLQHGEVDASLTAYDLDGKVLNSIYAVLPLDLKSASYNKLLKSGLPMKQSLDVPAGTVYLRAGILDPSNGHTGATEFPMAVKPAPASVARAGAPSASQP